jgi:hypothetical protein
MALTPLPDLVLYRRAECGLCDETRTFLAELLDARRAAGLPAPAVVERDIETSDDWHRAFFATIPVVELGGHRLELATSPAKVRRLLSDVLGG